MKSPIQKVFRKLTEKDIVVLLTAASASPSIISFIDECYELELMSLGFWDDDALEVTVAGLQFLRGQAAS